MNQFLNSLDVVFDIVKDYEEAKDIIFTKNVKYAPLLKKALGKRLNEIVTEKDNNMTRFGIGELITVREEPNKDGPEIFARADIQEGARIRNISFKRDNFGFLDIKFHTEEISFKDRNFLLTEACNSLFQDSVLNPLYLFEVYSFTCEYKEAKIIRDIGARFYSNRLELKCEELKKIVDDLKGEVQVE